MSDTATPSVAITYQRKGLFGKVHETALIRGKPIAHRREQQAIWTGIAAVFGVGAMAGLYWWLLQQHYPFFPGSGSLKLWWDNGMGIIHGKSWALYYRHGLRDKAEPLAWILIGGTILGKMNVKKKPLPLWLVVPGVIIMLALIVVCALGITWLVQVGPLKNYNYQHLTEIALGVGIGRLLHFAWAPIGGTIRYHIVARTALGDGPMPLWVRYPLMPPAWREGWAEMRAKRAEVKAEAGDHRETYVLAKILVPLAILAFLFLGVTGDIAKEAIPHGLNLIPFMKAGS